MQEHHGQIKQRRALNTRQALRSAARAERCTELTSRSVASGTKKLLDSITSVFGAKIKDHLTELTLQCPGDVSVKGLISKCAAGRGLSSGDRQFLFLNKRPVDVPKLTKAVNEVYKQYNMHQVLAYAPHTRCPVLTSCITLPVPDVLPEHHNAYRSPSVLADALAMRCPILTSRVVLWVRFRTGLRVCYAIPGTDLAYGAPNSRV
eukprot:3006914-Rhodomonas_salina.1